MLKQRVVLSKRTSNGDSPVPATGSSTNLPLSNPFKVLKGLRSAESFKDVDDPLTELSLVDTVDLGLLPLNGPIAGIRFDSTDFLASGLAWSDQELLVCNFSATYICRVSNTPKLFDISGLSVQALGVAQLADIGDVLRHDHNLVTVRLKV